jgi:hypothetical protein
MNKAQYYKVHARSAFIEGWVDAIDTVTPVYNPVILLIEFFNGSSIGPGAIVVTAMPRAIDRYW